MDRQRDIGFAIRRLSNLIKRDVEKSCCKMEIDTVKGVNGWAIRYFYENREKDIFQKDFESKFSIRRSTASKILKTMEQKGLIERKCVDSDARLKKILLTEKAIEVHKRITEDISHREKRLKQGISEEELSLFFQIMDKFSANMEEGK